MRCNRASAAGVKGVKVKNVAYLLVAIALLIWQHLVAAAGVEADKSKVSEGSTHLTFIGSLSLAETKNAPAAASVFVGYVPAVFTSDKSASLVANTSLYEMKKDGTFTDLFGSVSSDWRSLTLTPSEIVRWCKEYRNLLRQEDGQSTFFVYEHEGKLLVVTVVVFDGKLGLVVHPLENGHVWNAGGQDRLVVRQPKR